VKAAASEPAPVGAVTVTVAGPALGAIGVWQVIEVSLTTTRLVAATPPNVTAVAPVKAEPVMVTGVPPDCGPVVGARLVTTAAITVLVASWQEKVMRASALLAAGPASMLTRARADTAVAVVEELAADPSASQFLPRGSRFRTATGCAAAESRR
jgi:hypothetical protein